MKYNLLIIILVLLTTSCGEPANEEKSKIDLVVYPEYCGGCVNRNFDAIRSLNIDDKFNIHFDTTDLFILNIAKLNDLTFNHIDNSNIRTKFGDYANIVLFSSGKQPLELKTNEVIEKGKHY